ncbi:cache domain-containing sensor histidine kinase [Anaerobacterium chartisolvens]|uniref:sensor histidine kinase n=1 Tax=Anaerobacterium chartisolvens TaxID=1297424 RepID=UPI001A9A51A5
MQDINRITVSFQQYSADTYNSTTDSTIAEELKKLNDNINSWSQYDLYMSRKKMRFLCENLMYGYSYINGIYIFTLNGNYISYSSSGTDLKLGYTPFNDEWYKKTLENNGQLYVSDVEPKSFILNSKNSIFFSRAIFDTSTREFLGVLMLDCSLDIFNGLDRDIIPNITDIYLVNESGKILFDNEKNNIGQYLSSDILNKTSSGAEGSFEMEKGSVLTVYKSFPNNNWKVVASVSINELNKQFGITKKLIIYISGTCTVIFIILSVILSTFLTKPITELSDIMRKNKLHKLVIAKKKHLERIDEIGTLYNEYNNMINEINTYIKESYQNKLIALDSQMKALEAQINSHFLYNTLESIHSIAEIEEVNSIAIMSKALGDMFRYSIKTTSELVTVEEELLHVNNYLSIQKIRYEDKISFVQNIQVDLSCNKVLKLILQPIIENAIYHGLESKKSKGILTIKGYGTERELCFEIMDDGIGMSVEQVNEIKELLSEKPKFTELGQRNKRSIGIKNVHSRIQLYYGMEYGLSFESEQNSGTKVKVRVPRVI